MVAKTTKHRDPKSLLVYNETNARSKLKSALAVGKVINIDSKKRKRDVISSDEEESYSDNNEEQNEDDEEDDDFSS